MIRYQGAIVLDRHVLLIKQRHHDTGRSYWLFPGGGIEPGETDEECVTREMKEETNLEVRIIRLILDEPELAELAEVSPYARVRTYLCQPSGGQARPGYEPEASASAIYTIVSVGWFDLQSETNWDPLLVNDPVTYSRLQGVRRRLGYLAEQY